MADKLIYHFLFLLKENFKDKIFIKIMISMNQIDYNYLILEMCFNVKVRILINKLLCFRL